jgi:DNA helicase HerA-like ATPase
MNKEDKQRVIGKVVGINSDRFTIELLSGIDNFNINGFDDIHYFAQLNSYLILPYQNYYIVAEVSGVREKDLNITFNNPTEQFLNKVKSGKYLEVLPIGTLKLNAAPTQSYLFDFGVSVYPALYTDALYIKEAELDAIFNVNEQEIPVCNQPMVCGTDCTCAVFRYKTLSIGKSTIFPDYQVKIDIDKFFGGHSAILGNTGSGKSCTISAVIQELFRYKANSPTGATFLFFDVNGEYEQAFAKLNSNNENIKVGALTLDREAVTDSKPLFTLPHSFLNFDEWALLLQASDRTQQPVLRNALNIGRLLEDVNADIDALKNHIVACCCLYVWRNTESPVAAGHKIDALLNLYASGGLSNILLNDLRFNFQYGNFPANTNNEQIFKDTLIGFVIKDFTIPDTESGSFKLKNLYDYIDIAILYEESFGNKQIRDYCSSLLTRTKAIIDRKDYQFLDDSVTTIEEYQYLILGLNKSERDSFIRKDNQIVIVDLSSIDDEITEVVSCVLSRLVYETIKKLRNRNSFPVNLVLEEAHRYVSDHPHRAFLKANKIFEQIAKEGRKYGMFLTISSQRPCELSKTVLSQCSNFIVHRIQNPEDLSHIRQITPHISETILKRMPSIPTQHALIFGHAVNLPTTFKVYDAVPTPKSENNKISVNWFKAPTPLINFDS